MDLPAPSVVVVLPAGRSDVMRAWRACAAAPSAPGPWAHLRQLIEALPFADAPGQSARTALLEALDQLISSGNHLCPVDRSYFHRALFGLLWQQGRDVIQP